MPDPTTAVRTDRPSEGYHTALLSAHPERPVRLFVPSDYQRKYAYPFIVLFHDEGSQEDAAASFVPLMSRRNYITACPRGPVPMGSSGCGRRSYGWGQDARVDDYLLATVAHARDKFHVHSERIYVIGIGESATIASRFVAEMADDVAGLVLLNSRFASSANRPVFSRKAFRGKRVFIGHGASNPLAPFASARRTARQLGHAGAEVECASFPTTHRIHPDMLRDVNRWIMGAVNKNPDSLTPPNQG